MVLLQYLIHILILVIEFKLSKYTEKSKLIDFILKAKLICSKMEIYFQ